MKKLLLLLLISSVTFYTFGNEPIGNYINNNDSICFSDGKLIFSISDFGALTTKIVGEGAYKIIDNYLLLNTGEYSGIKSSIEYEKAVTNDSIAINIKNTDGYPLQDVLVEFLSTSNKTIDRAISDDSGNINIPHNEKIARLRVSLLGYNGVNIKYDKNLDYTVELAKNKVIENQTMLFDLQVEDEDTITLTILSEDFSEGKNLNKALERAYKRAQKTNMLGKRFKKEYVSVFYNR